MVEIGKTNTLRVVKEVDFGVYLDGEEFGEILLPTRYVPEGTSPEDEVEVFLYFDSDDRLIATTDIPYAQIDQFASLKVVATTKVGAFLDWGLMKDLLVPFREQKVRMVEGVYYIVYVYLDPISNRIVASSKVDKFIAEEKAEYEVGEEVDLLVYDRTDIGFKAIINGADQGIIFENEVFRKLKTGEALKGYIKQIREDGKIDLSLQKQGMDQVDDFAQVLLNELVECGGFLGLTDKSSPEEIYKYFGVSKKNFKRAVGTLYKKKRIVLSEDGIRLSE